MTVAGREDVECRAVLFERHGVTANLLNIRG
jgi:hypothetical protein